jgi:hypothetical protein
VCWLVVVRAGGAHCTEAAGRDGEEEGLGIVLSRSVPAVPVLEPAAGTSRPLTARPARRTAGRCATERATKHRLDPLRTYALCFPFDFEPGSHVNFLAHTGQAQ